MHLDGNWTEHVAVVGEGKDRGVRVGKAWVGHGGPVWARFVEGRAAGESGGRPCPTYRSVFRAEMPQGWLVWGFFLFVLI